MKNTVGSNLSYPTHPEVRNREAKYAAIKVIIYKAMQKAPELICYIGTPCVKEVNAL
jgi:hypothetical protein